jgi:hypothetical protein
MNPLKAYDRLAYSQPFTAIKAMHLTLIDAIPGNEGSVNAGCVLPTQVYPQLKLGKNSIEGMKPFHERNRSAFLVKPDIIIL